MSEGREGGRAGVGVEGRKKRRDIRTDWIDMDKERGSEGSEEGVKNKEKEKRRNKYTRTSVLGMRIRYGVQ